MRQDQQTKRNKEEKIIIRERGLVNPGENF